MSERSAAMGFARLSSGLPPPKVSAWALDTKDQVMASTRPRAASVRRPVRARFCSGVSTAREMLSDFGSGVDITLSRPTMRMTSSTRSALPCTSGRQLGAATFKMSLWPEMEKPSRLQNEPDLGGMKVEAGETLHFGQREIDGAARVRNFAGDENLGRLAAAQIENEPGREFETRHHEVRIDAAFEAVARIGMNAERAAGLRDVERIPQRALDQDVGRRIGAARGFPAHDAGERFNALVIGDDNHVRIERVGLAVERKQRFARLGAANRKIARNLGGVEHMQRPRAVDRQEIGHVDERIDRTKAYGAKLLLQPFRRRAVLDPAHETQRESRREVRIVEVEHHLDGARERALHGLRLLC